MGELDYGNVWFLRYVVFYIGTFMLTIVGLNLLISIIGDTFDSVINNWTGIDYKLKVELMREVSSFQKLLKKKS